MKKAKELREITNTSNVGFAKELARIEKEMIDRANGGYNSLKTNAPAEIAQKVRDELTLHGYQVETVYSGNDISVSW